MKTIAVIGFGKIGQAIAANILQHPVRVIAVDINKDLLKAFQQDSYDTKEPGLNELLLPAYRQQRLLISDDLSSIKDSDCIIISIPLFIDGQKKILDKPFLETIYEVARFVANNVPVIIETSVPIGFIRNSVLPVMQSVGKHHGKDFLLAHSPERIKSGTMLEQLRQVPKVIGGVSEEATECVFHIYRQFFDDAMLLKVESVEAAEMLKLAGMIYRDVNIALSNQLAKFADLKGIDFTRLIPLINTDKEANLLQPGIGVGGHCTPVYPYFLIDNFDKEGLEFSLAKQSRHINNTMAAYAVSLIKDKVKAKTALILGLGFRPNVKEDALSTAYLLQESLVQAGFEIVLHDTEFGKEEIISKGFVPVEDIYNAAVEVVFLVTMHLEYQGINFEKLKQSGVNFFVDGRNAIDKQKVERAGIQYFGIGH